MLLPKISLSLIFQGFSVVVFPFQAPVLLTGHWYLPRNSYIFLIAGYFFFHTKSMIKCTVPSSAHWDFSPHCLSGPTLNVAVIQLLFTFSLHSYTPPTHTKTWLFPPSSGCMRFLHRWPQVWAEAVSLVCNHGGDIGFWVTCICSLLMPSGPTWL